MSRDDFWRLIIADLSARWRVVAWRTSRRPNHAYFNDEQGQPHTVTFGCYLGRTYRVTLDHVIVRRKWSMNMAIPPPDLRTEFTFHEDEFSVISNWFPSWVRTRIDGEPLAPPVAMSNTKTGPFTDSYAWTAKAADEAAKTNKRTSESRASVVRPAPSEVAS